MARRHKRRRPMSEINVVPYIDVMLVLLIVFMVAAPMLMQGVEVELPKAVSKPVTDKQEEPLIVSIKADGSLYLNLGKNQDTPKALDLIQEQIQKVLSRKPGTSVMVWGDQAVSYGEIIQLMSALQASGVNNVGLVTEPL